MPKEREEIDSIEPRMIDKIYYHTALSGRGNIVSLVGENNETSSYIQTNVKSIKFKDIDMNILLGASEYFEELRFDILKEKYPKLISKKEFLTSEKFLGNSRVEITYSQNELSGKEIFLAIKHALTKIASHILSLKPEYRGSYDFSPKMLQDVLKDKKISLEKIDANGGKGDSQNNCIEDEYRLDLRNEKWYVFNDNYGTSEEKLFVKYFKTSIEPKLQAKDLEYYVVRNERIPDLAIYSFEAGERFEPDFLLFVRKKKTEGSITYQGYAEPKGSHLLKQDLWKEDFSLQIEENHTTGGILAEDYKIIGFPFFNKEERMKEFEAAIKKWLEKI